MNSTLREQFVVVTVRAFAGSGAQVIGTSRSTEELDKLAQDYLGVMICAPSHSGTVLWRVVC